MGQVWVRPGTDDDREDLYAVAFDELGAQAIFQRGDILSSLKAWGTNRTGQADTSRRAGRPLNG